MHPDETFEIEYANGKGSQGKQDHERERPKDSMGIDGAQCKVESNCSNVFEDIVIQHVGDEQGTAIEFVRKWISRRRFASREVWMAKYATEE